MNSKRTNNNNKKEVRRGHESEQKMRYFKIPLCPIFH